MKMWISLLGALGFAAYSGMASDHEPVYQGITFSEWANRLDPHGAYIVGQEPPEVLAIREIGTNAIPTLLKWIVSNEPAEHSHDSEKRPLAPCFYPSKPQRATMVFNILGEKARPAIPELTKLAMRYSDHERVDRCIDALSSIGTEALPSFRVILANGSTSARWSALSYLAVFHSNAVVALPEAIQCLISKNEDLSWKAASELSNLKIPANVLVPALTNAMSSASSPSRARIIRTLFWLNPSAESAIPALRVALVDRNKQVRSEATNALQKIAPQILKNTSGK